MKHHGLLFSAPMARANIEGRKTVTRRGNGLPRINVIPDFWRFDGVISDTTGDRRKIGCASWAPVRNKEYDMSGSVFVRPPVSVGNLIYQKETWAPCDCGRPDCPGMIYRANGDPAIPIKWKSSLFLRKVDSRFWAEVVSVRVERLQEITDSDSEAEGIDTTNASIPGYLRERYRRLWETINGPGSWDANPWVWRIEYRSVARPELAALHA